jgi:spore germination protein YaaH
VTETELASSSAVIFSGLCVAANGTIDESPGECANGAAGLASGTFTSLVADAHQVGTKVLLSLNAFSDTTIGVITSHPKAAAAALASAVLPIVTTDQLDGINIDIEGSDPTEAAGFVAFIKAFTRDLRGGDPSGEVVLDAYAASASGDANFFDIARLAPLVDRVFAEAYQMNSAAHASPNSPLKSSSLGYSVVQTLVQYERQMPASKLILGVPFYGLDFTTANATPGASALTPAPESFTYDDIVAAGRTALWDPASLTPYAVFRRDGGWHQLWYDDPVSIALKVALAVNMHAAGVGAWALGMETNAPSMLNALTGASPPKKLSTST